MSERTPTTNAFEFAALAGQRAKQLMRGCTPRVEGDEKPTRLARREIATGVISKVEEEEE